MSLHLDAWVNTMAGIGTLKDKTEGGYFYRDSPLDDEQISALFYGNAIARKIVCKIPELIHQAGYTLESENAEAALGEVARLEIGAKILQAHTLGRAFGGAAAILLADDGGALEEPLRLDKIRSFAGVNVVDRRYLHVVSRQSDPSQPGLGEPVLIDVLPQPIPAGATAAPQGGVRIHVSRMLLFYGLRVDVRELSQARGFGYSVLQPLYSEIRSIAQAMKSLDAMLLEASVSVFKIKDLIAQLTSGNRDILLERMAVTNLAKSTTNSVLLDADREDYTRVASQFNGVSDVIDRKFQFLASAADYPMTILFGTSPAGLNATGESDTKQFYNRVSSVREDEVEPQLRRAFEIVFASLGFAAEPFEIGPGPLEVVSPMQEAVYRKAVADTDAVYITNSVLEPEAVALARFGQGFNPTASPAVNVAELEAALLPEPLGAPATTEPEEGAS